MDRVRTIVELTTGDRALAHTDDPLRIGHLLPQQSQVQPHFDRQTSHQETHHQDDAFGSSKREHFPVYYSCTPLEIGRVKGKCYDGEINRTNVAD